MSHQRDWLRGADVAIMEYLDEEHPDYVPLIASHRGINLSYARRRVDRLEDAGLVEAVSAEVVYRITDDGRAQLEAHGESEAETPERQLVVDD